MNKIINAHKKVFISSLSVVLLLIFAAFLSRDTSMVMPEPDLNNLVTPTVIADSPMKLLMDATTTSVDTTEWRANADSNFDLSFKYPSTWLLSTSSDERGVYFLTVTDSDPKNQVKISFTSHQNCNGNGYGQPEFQGLKVSDSKWNDEQTYIGRGLCFPDKQFFIVMTADSVQAKNIEEQILATVNFVHPDTNGWRHFSDNNLGLEFEYPAYLGHVIVEKYSRGCPDMKTYARNGQLLTADYAIWFTNLQHIGTGASYMEYYIPIIKTENNTEICGRDLFNLRKDITSDPQYQSSTFVQPNATDAYVSTVDTTIGTSANQFYTLYFIKRNMMTVVQPVITFIPVASSYEENEISKNETIQDPFSSIVDFVLYSDNAKQIRDYMSDFKILVSSMKITN